MVAVGLVERRWRAATAIAAFGGTILLNLVTAGNQSRVEHDAIFGVSLAGVAYAVAAFAADRRTQNRRRQPSP
jgi:hypothetical protein